MAIEVAQGRNVEVERIVVPLREWLSAQRLSRSWYYKFYGTDLVPETVVIGARRFVTVAAARRWAERLERAGAA